MDESIEILSDPNSSTFRKGPIRARDKDEEMMIQELNGFNTGIIKQSSVDMARK